MLRHLLPNLLGPVVVAATVGMGAIVLAESGRGGPGSSARPALRSARTSLSFLPVIVLTGDETHVARNTALILGADEFLTKPVDRQEFVLRVRNLLHTRDLYVAAREGRPD